MRLLNSFDTRAELGTDNYRDNYGARLSGLFVPSVTGNYDFYSHSDDSSQLFLNPNGIDPAGRVEIAAEDACCNDWPIINSLGRLPAGHSTGQAGQAYYLEGLYKEGGGGDYIRVAARLDGRMPPAGPAIRLQNLGQSAAQGTAGEVTITQDPVGQIVEENHEACFSVAGENTYGLPQCYQWYKDGVAIPGATEPTYCALVTAADNGAMFSADVGIVGYKARSAAAVAAVIPDVTEPSVVSVKPTRNLNQIVLHFDERIDAGIATDAFNYDITPPYNIASIDVSADEKTVTINLNQIIQPDETACLTLLFLTDIAGNVAPETTECVSSSFYDCFVKQEWYYNIGGVTIADLTGNANYPDHPDRVNYLPAISAPQSNPDLSNFGTRLSGWLKPPVTGNYTFATYSDDASQVWVSTDVDPANKQLVVEETACCNAWPAINSTTLFPGGVPLEAGKLYYFEALMKEGGGGDYVHVTWSIPPDTRIFASTAGQQPISAKYVVQLSEDLGTSLNITQQPQDQTFIILPPDDSGDVTFNVAAEGSGVDAAVSYQWQRNDGAGWQDILGATGSSYGFVPFRTDDGAQFRAALCYPNIKAYSDAATLTVVQPNSAPMFVGGPEQEVFENSGPVTVVGWASGIAVDGFGVPPVPATIVYGSDFSSQPEGSTLFANAEIADGVLKLVHNVNGENGSFYSPVLDVPVQSYEVSFKLLIGGGTEPPADGFSVNMANDLPNPPTANEDGMGTGLTVSFDIYNNGGQAAPQEAPAIDLKWQGQLLKGFLAQVAQSTNMDLDVFKDVTVSVTADGLATLSYDGTNVFENVPIPGYRWQSGLQLGMGARTGGLNANQWVDDLMITAIPYDPAALERGQTAQFLVSNDNPDLFAEQPALSPDGTLTYTPAANRFGTSIVTVVLMDNGGTDQGGIDRTAPLEFPITVIASPMIPPGGISEVDTTSPRVRQTGLFYQSVTISNPTPAAYDALRLYVMLPEDQQSVVKVWNATGTNEGVPYIQFNNPLAAGASIDLEVEFYVADRRTLPAPTYRVESVEQDTGEPPVGTQLEILRQKSLGNGSFLVEFNTLSNRTYFVQYQDNLDGDWKTAQPAIIGNGSRIQWIDSGPPKTDSRSEMRIYRIVLMPQD